MAVRYSKKIIDGIVTVYKIVNGKIVQYAKLFVDEPDYWIRVEYYDIKGRRVDTRYVIIGELAPCYERIKKLPAKELGNMVFWKLIPPQEEKMT